jgi:hypothetical protein
VINRIATATADTDHLDYCFLRLCINQFNHVNLLFLQAK